MLCYITCVILLYMCQVMLYIYVIYICYITCHVMLYNIRYVMSYNRKYVMLYDIKCDVI